MKKRLKLLNELMIWCTRRFEQLYRVRFLALAVANRDKAIENNEVYCPFLDKL